MLSLLYTGNKHQALTGGKVCALLGGHGQVLHRGGTFENNRGGRRTFGDGAGNSRGSLSLHETNRRHPTAFTAQKGLEGLDYTNATLVPLNAFRTDTHQRGFHAHFPSDIGNRRLEIFLGERFRIIRPDGYVIATRTKLA